MRLSLPLAIVLFSMSARSYAQQQGTAQTPSTLLQPALDSVAKAGSAVDLNRWKGPNNMRADVDANLASMQKDMQVTLPPLLTAADAAPSAVSASLPVLLNLDALYSVLLRVTIASRTGAPRDQNEALEQSALLLDSARRDLGQAILAAATAQEKRAVELQGVVQQQTATPAAAQEPSPAVAAPAPKPKKRRVAPKPAPAPAPAQ